MCVVNKATSVKPAIDCLNCMMISMKIYAAKVISIIATPSAVATVNPRVFLLIVGISLREQIAFKVVGTLRVP